jgi:hypothetical protein
MIDSDLFEPYEKLIEIELLGRAVRVPENNRLLRCFQFLSLKSISYGDFCWAQRHAPRPVRPARRHQSGTGSRARARRRRAGRPAPGFARRSGPPFTLIAREFSFPHALALHFEAISY